VDARHKPGHDEERQSMKKPTVRCSKGEIGRVRIVEDFLPSPDRLVRSTGAQLIEVLESRSQPQTGVARRGSKRMVRKNSRQNP
jgi:hypothetical protein